MTTTTAKAGQIRRQIQEFAFTPLFIESLGWDYLQVAPLTVVVGEATYTLRPVAQKRGVVALRCEPDARGGIPDYLARKAIDGQVWKSYHEHFIIYTDRDDTMQVWQWVKRQPGKPAAWREQRYFKGQSGEALAQRLTQLYVDFSVEDALGLTDVLGLLRQSFDVDKVTKRFYDRFKTEHKAFLDVIAGIQSEPDREWYASLMLNRLMFTYFIQWKGFLAGDRDYLRHKLEQTRARFGADQFHSFYREFLLHFFHDGLGAPVDGRPAEMRALIGDVPYMNGGLFERHRIEDENTIAIPDAAFEKVFDVLRRLELEPGRPARPPGQRDQPGRAGLHLREVHQPEADGGLLHQGGHHRLHQPQHDAALPAGRDAQGCPGGLRHWTARSGGCCATTRPLHLRRRAQGRRHPAARRDRGGDRDVAKRGGWNRPAAPDYALPTETWREHVARRQRCLDLRAKLAAGEVSEVNDLITYNLDITQFARDVIEQLRGAGDGARLLEGAGESDACWTRPAAPARSSSPRCASWSRSMTPA